MTQNADDGHIILPQHPRRGAKPLVQLISSRYDQGELHGVYFGVTDDGASKKKLAGTSLLRGIFVRCGDYWISGEAICPVAQRHLETYLNKAYVRLTQKPPFSIKTDKQVLWRYICLKDMFM